MKILDNLVAQSILLALILSVPMLFATGLPGSKNYSFKFNHIASTNTVKIPESNTPTNSDTVTVDEPEQQEIQQLKEASAPTRLSKIINSQKGAEQPN